MADERGETRAVARDLNPAESRLGFLGQPDRLRRVLDARVGAQAHSPDQPGDEQHRDQRPAELNPDRQAPFSPARASIIGLRPLRSYPAFAAASTHASPSSPDRAPASAPT